ncbi:MAG: LolA family protein [Planctomycetota bacterium]|jgi:outer membrane lipoprotein-sorting protein
MKKGTLTAVAAAMVLGLSAGAWAETIESVEKAITERSKEIRSMSYNSTYWSDMQTADMKNRTEGKTAYEYMLKGETPLYRMETTSKTVQEMGGNKTTTSGSTTSVCDGQFIYLYSDYGDYKSATKSKATNDITGLVDSNYFTMMRQSYDLSLKPDAKVGPHDAWVILAKLKQVTPGVAVEQDMYFDKETGVVVRTVARDANGKVTMESNTTDLKVNSTISEDRFVFQAPEGVEVIDMTQQQGAAPAGDNAQASDKDANTDKSDSKSAKKKEEKKDKKGILKKLKRKWP